VFGTALSRPDPTAATPPFCRAACSMTPSRPLALPTSLSLTMGLNAIAHRREALYAPILQPIIGLFSHGGMPALPCLCWQADLTDRVRGIVGAAWWPGFAGMPRCDDDVACIHILCHVLAARSNRRMHGPTPMILPDVAAVQTSPSAPRRASAESVLDRRPCRRADATVPPLVGASCLHSAAERRGGAWPPRPSAAYFAFVVVATLRRILGWRVASTMATSMCGSMRSSSDLTRQQKVWSDLKDVCAPYWSGLQYPDPFQRRLAEAGITPRWERSQLL